MQKWKGKTGPIGAVGIVERLRLKFGRESDEDEVEAEVVRDKGYLGQTKIKLSTTSLKWGSLEQKGTSDYYRDSKSQPQVVTGGEQSTGHIEINSRQEKVGRGVTEMVSIENQSPPTLCGDKAGDILTPTYNCRLGLMSELSSHFFHKIIMKQVEEVRLGPFGDSTKGQMIVESLLKQLPLLKTKVATQISSHHSSRSAATYNNVSILKTPGQVHGAEYTGGVEEVVHVME